MKKILFIEDEASLQKAVGDILTEEKFEVISALDGEVGLRFAKDQKPDLILLDLILPKMNGIEVLKELKASQETKDIPVIVLTNSEEMEHIQQAIDLGATTYLVKINYKLDEVVEKIKGVLNAG
ncbi:response regulator [Patescibacteria group bacterium]|nr:response regulator [Patescibacteria group bacterium]